MIRNYGHVQDITYLYKITYVLEKYTGLFRISFSFLLSHVLGIHLNLIQNCFILRNLFGNLTTSKKSVDCTVFTLFIQMYVYIIAEIYFHFEFIDMITLLPNMV